MEGKCFYLCTDHVTHNVFHNDMLLGNIDWLHSTLKLTIHILDPLFYILEGDPVLTSPRALTSQTNATLDKVSVAHTQLSRVRPSLSTFVINFPTQHMPTGIPW